ncbi:MAG: hypothetical protein H5U27_08565 [Methyloversatilis sp.]|uniref:hypothetical protein n=1 Tax=Methyloversatilis sp. NSM2 TaxID=3134135 RepID=UPI0019A3B1DD|nr:hypothetical protein [Methyloversatilis sp.]
MKRSLFALLAVLALMLSGCAVNRATATVDPSADLGSLKSLHVKKKADDDRAIDQLIATELRSRGYTVTTDPDVSQTPDATVSYVDKWFWDITMYMLELTIIISDPKDDYPLASGNSLHTSLTRKSPPEMVTEVLDNIFKKQEK